jgi:hypothetical protein
MRERVDEVDLYLCTLFIIQHAVYLRTPNKTISPLYLGGTPVLTVVRQTTGEGVNKCQHRSTL